MLTDWLVMHSLFIANQARQQRDSTLRRATAARTLKIGDVTWLATVTALFTSS